MSGPDEDLIDDDALIGGAPEGASVAVGRQEVDDAARLDAILDIDLPLVVRFGHTELSLKTLTQLGPGSVIDLARSAHEPVEVLVSGRVVARGEVVVVAGNYGVRITDVVSPGERMSNVEV